MSDKPIEQWRIRSFIRRQGRVTAGQKMALEYYWDDYCLDPQQPLNLETAFANTAPIIVEIGFGNGESLAQMAENNPQNNYLGIEVHRPGVGHLLRLLAERNIDNVRVFHHDAIDILQQKIPDNTLAGIHLFFPDPWHKRRHHKRRIVRPSFVELLEKKLQSGGYFHAATDWEHYAKEMLKTLSASTRLKNMAEDNRFCPRPDYRLLTKFEKRGLRLGHGVWDLIFTRL
ncbi:tRNA (guanosine(46)-N7)-methyltransferase TrmB [methane-oxidizing endosymbiont of Gigantopelta aegis]|uniref:tRNA (guanosine(46)-N7)-methyltransferase TrmB n=1 Tax=methane-oxidizing endosymbiont of Gigantopelta aegis TaxID=2794938 RepID=UPI0018DD03AF|nr:tRNA (guanosine(46)-N7)-methyltransferase TrmB [methane-oxidizing endosymbiont of Gigantopelta aegis]